MHRYLAPVMFALCLNSAASAAPRPEVSPYLRAYSGGDGVVVWVVRVGPRQANEALIQVVGIDHELDRRIRRVRVEPTTAGERYVTIDSGLKVLVMGQSGMEFIGPVPGGAIKVAYDRARTEQGDAEHFLTQYLEQK